MRAGWTGAARAAGAAMVAGLAMAASGSLSAQQNNGSQAQPSIMVDEKSAVAPAQSPQSPKPAKSKRARVQTPAAEQNPDLDAADQLAPSQVSQPLPAAVPAPTRTQTTALAAPPGAAAGKPPRANSNLVVACSGAFAKDTKSSQAHHGVRSEERRLHRGRGRLGQDHGVDPLSEGSEEKT